MEQVFSNHATEQTVSTRGSARRTRDDETWINTTREQPEIEAPANSPRICCPNCGHNIDLTVRPARQDTADITNREEYRVIDLDQDSDEDMPTPGEDAATSGSRNTQEEQTVPNDATRVGKNSRKGLKKGEQVGQARRPGAALLKFCSTRYGPFNWSRHRDFTVENPGSFKGDYSIYNTFKLLTGPIPQGTQLADIPKNCVRLDDRWVAYVSLHFPKTKLTAYWPAEFDSNGMLRATRVPLGAPCLIWVTAGHKDVDNRVALQDGLYYGWYRGLQPLFGDEGFGRYLVRPSFEKTLCPNIGFKVICPAVGGYDRADFETVVEGSETKVVIKTTE